ncbi:MAG: hypothetical protein ABIR33_05320 [Pyrinomonadaceae bacterium]
MTVSRLDVIESELLKLGALDAELASLKLQGGNVRARDLQRLAQTMGFGPKRKKRGGEPTWIRDSGTTISIPDHSGTLGKGLASKIIKGMRDELFIMTEALKDEKEVISGQTNQLKYRNYYD